MNSNDSAKTSELGDHELATYFKRETVLKNRMMDGYLDWWTVVSTFQHLLDSKPLRPFSLVPPPMKQIQMARLLNRAFGWGIDEWTFECAIDRHQFTEVSTLQKLKPTQAIVLNFNLSGDAKYSFTGKTFGAAWSAIDAIQLKLHSNFSDDPIVRRVTLECDTPFWAPHWVAIDFSENKSYDSVKSLCEKEDLPGNEVFWALVYNPNLVIELKEFGIHTIWPGGLRLGHRDGERVPVLGFDRQSQTLEMDPGHPGHKGSKLTIPRFFDPREM